MPKSFIEQRLNKLTLMDALEFLRNLPDESVDMIHTDPPWGKDHLKSKYFDDTPKTLEQIIDSYMEKMERALKEGGHIYMQVPSTNLPIFLFSFIKYFKLDTILVARNKTSGYPVKGRYKTDTQLIIHGSKGSPRKFEEAPIQPYSEAWQTDQRNKSGKKFSYVYSSFFDIRANSEKHESGHPNEKNIELIEKFILVASKPGEIILDPFAGSMSTAKAAAKHGRNFLTCDLVDWSSKYNDDPKNAA